MSISHLLDTFDTTTLSSGLNESAQDSRADMELAIYERGYTAGWDDSERSHKESEVDSEAEFKNALRELSFTYQEAYTAIVKSLEPLFKQIVEVTLPALAHESLGLTLKEQVMQVARTHAGSALEVVCHPSQEARLSALIEGDQAMQTRIASDPSLGEGQITLRFSDEERQIDIEALNSKMKSAVKEFFTELKKEPKHV